MVILRSARSALALLLMVSVVTPVAFAARAENPTPKLCNKALLKALKTNLYDRSKDLTIPRQGSMQSEADILNTAFHTVNKTDLEALFEGPNAVGFEEIDSLWFAVQSKKYKAPAGLAVYLTGLRNLGLDHPSLFSGASDTVERIQAVLGSSEKRQNLSGVFSESQKLQSNLKQSEENLIIQALSEMRGYKNKSSKFLDGYRNTFSPHLSRVKEMVQFNQDMRQILNLTFVADEPVAYYGTKYLKDLEAPEKEVLHRLLADTKGKLEDTFKNINDGYDTDLLGGKALQIGDARLRKLEASLEEIKSGQKRDTAVNDAEKDMDAVDIVVRAIRTRQGLPARDFTEMHDRELQIRFDQYTRETQNLIQEYESLLNQKADNTNYSVDASWTVTVQHSKQETRSRQVPTYDSQGKQNGSRTEFYTETIRWTTSYGMSGSFTLAADYHELLDRNITPSVSEVSAMLPYAQTRGAHADSASNGTPSIDRVDERRIKAILADSEEIAKRENSIRKAIEATLGKTQTIIEKYEELKISNQARNQAVAEIEALFNRLTDLLTKESTAYAQLSSGEFQQLWSTGDYDHYQSRSKVLLERNQHLINRLTYFKEEVRRQIETLGVYTFTPNYAAQLKELDSLSTTRWIKFSIKHILLAALIGGGTYGYVDPVAHQKIQDKWQQTVDWYNQNLGTGSNPSY